jgi:ABC-type dipeptide/oligopeptide/nickel transport system permease subunit
MDFFCWGGGREDIGLDLSGVLFCFIFILMHNVIMGFISSGNGIPLGTVDGWMNGWIDFALGCMYHYRK